MGKADRPTLQPSNTPTQIYGKENHRHHQAADPGGSGESRAAGRPGARPARRQHHGFLQGIQRGDQGRRGTRDSRRHHRFSGQVVQVHHQIAAGVHSVEKGRGHHRRFQGAEQGKGRQGDAQTGFGHRENEVKGFKCDFGRSRVPGHRRHGAQHGN